MLQRRRFTGSHSQGSASCSHGKPAWGHAQPISKSCRAKDVCAAAGADAQAFESLLAAAEPLAKAGGTAATDVADALEAAEAATDLLPPILQLHNGATRYAWAAPDGTLLEVIHRPGVPQEGACEGWPDAAAAGPQHQQQEPQQQGGAEAGGDPQHSARPPLVFIHGLFRGAWCWDEALMPALSSAGYDCYALSLRGQGASRLGAGMARVARARGGVPLAVNVADVAAFVASLPAGGPPPVLVGHSLGGTFVQEYLSLLARQRQQEEDGTGGVETGGGDGGAETGGVEMPPLPQLSGAVALASACAGTVMAFGDFVRDVGLREFLFQMYIVFSGAHLKDEAVARYCWWSDRLPEGDAGAYHRACRGSSRVLPYITSEIGAWAPPPIGLVPRIGGGTDGEGGVGAALPPVLAIGGEEDRIIRPFQVEAFKSHWGARVSVLPGVTHDAMLGGQALRVAVELLAWLEALPSLGGGPPEAGEEAGREAEQESTAGQEHELVRRP